MFGLMFLKFAGAGLVGTSAHYLTLFILVQIVGADAVVASFTGALLGAVINYLLAYHYVFASEKKHGETAVKYAIVASGAIVVNTLSMNVLVHFLTLNYVIAQLITSLVALGYSFVVNTLWTFKAS